MKQRALVPSSASWDGLSPFPWRMFLATSNSHIQVNKDTPDCVGLSADQVPEPATLTLLLGGAWLLAWRRRRRA
ncbi:MAG: PEP-CTERM sorting domain-containing protein [Planctomycetes bacterium]|nr:PEP-CTERM sorting domain-containing protein [Planctomycetota bacterium]